jgi:hypothetical protein
MQVELYSAFSKLRLSVMDEDTKKRERELSVMQGALARVLREEQAARPVPIEGAVEEQAAILIHLPAKEEFRRTGFDSPLSG